MISFWLTLAILALIGCFVAREQKTIDDAFFIYTAGSVLIASCVTDVRGLMRVYSPPEIIALTGTTRFFGTQLASSLVVSVVLMMPLILATTLVPSRSHTYLVVQGLCLAIFGFSVGTTVGTLLVPSTRDIAGQLLSALVTSGMFFGLARVPAISKLLPEAQNIVYIALSGLLILGSLFIEHQRNNYTWRTI